MKSTAMVLNEKVNIKQIIIVSNLSSPAGHRLKLSGFTAKKNMKIEDMAPIIPKKKPEL